MKKTILFPAFTACVMLFTSCQEAAKQETPAETPVAAAVVEPAKPDLAKIRSEIVAVENAWADAINKKDTSALMALYADDALSMQDAGPTLVGKAEIQKKQEKDFAAAKANITIGFETMDVYAQGDFATEVGKTIFKDAAGKITGSGKYIAVFEKKDGKYLCIREIYNKDSK